MSDDIDAILSRDDVTSLLVHAAAASGETLESMRQRARSVLSVFAPKIDVKRALDALRAVGGGE